MPGSLGAGELRQGCSHIQTYFSRIDLVTAVATACSYREQCARAAAVRRAQAELVAAVAQAADGGGPAATVDTQADSTNITSSSSGTSGSTGSMLLVRSSAAAVAYDPSSQLLLVTEVEGPTAVVRAYQQQQKKQHDDVNSGWQVVREVCRVPAVGGSRWRRQGGSYMMAAGGRCRQP